jgi:hypothetical protein
MSASAVEVRLQFQLLFWYGVIAVAMLITGMLLAANVYAIAFLLAAFGWLITLPYHAWLSVIVSTIMFRAAFIVPFMPGRPYLWEVGVLLAWTGVPLTIMLRKGARDAAEIYQRNRWVFIGSTLYCVVLLVTMMVRGFGLNVLGSTEAGGRAYLQQILCGMLPVLFLLLPLNRKQFFWLVILQLGLTVTFLISDFALSLLPGGIHPALYFFELSTDALNFEQTALSFGIRRYQSLGWFFTSVVYLLFVAFHSREFSGRRAWWLLPAVAGSYAISLLSGSRTAAALPLLVLAGILWANRFFDARKIMLCAVGGLFLVILAYGTAKQAPLSVQRALCILPGINVSSEARYDAEGTWNMRRTLRRIGMNMAPNYLWMGRGYSVSLAKVETSRFDWALEQHLRAGSFYNGAIGLLVNTGLAGLFAVLLLFYGGTRIAMRVIRHAREHGVEDAAMRAAVFIAVLWVAEMLFFIFVHGDAQQTLRRFGMIAGLLIAADRLIRQSVEEAEDQETTSATGTEQPAEAA